MRHFHPDNMFVLYTTWLIKTESRRLSNTLWNRLSSKRCFVLLSSVWPLNIQKITFFICVITRSRTAICTKMMARCWWGNCDPLFKFSIRYRTATLYESVYRKAFEYSTVMCVHMYILYIVSGLTSRIQFNILSGQCASQTGTTANSSTFPPQLLLRYSMVLRYIKPHG